MDIRNDNPQGRLTAILCALELARRLQVPQVWHGQCPQCENPVFAEKAHWDVVCGFCGHGPFRLYRRPGPKRRIEARSPR